MSSRYPGAWVTDGGFNPLTAPTPVTTYYPYLYSWGYNNRGQLGIGNTTQKNSPNQVGALTNWLNVAAGYYFFSLAVKTDGTLWSWGAGVSFGALGLGNTSNYSSPMQVGSLTNWLKVTANYGAGLAIKTNGTLWAWGQNVRGNLGLGVTTYYSSPKQVGALTNWLNIYGGNQHNLAIKTDGSLWSWGFSNHGQLGLGNNTYYSSPKQIGLLTNWSTASAGRYHSAAIKTDGTLWTWGYNSQGQLGLSSTTQYLSPMQVGALTNWATVICNSQSTLAVKIDGTLWAWGYNLYGQLGNGNTTQQNSPIQIGALTNWKTLYGCVNGTSYGTAAIKTDGTLWTWGCNSFGQLGITVTGYYSSPKQVGALTTWINVANSGSSMLGLAY